MAGSEGLRKAIAQRLRLAREQAGLSQGQVAKLLGYHRPSITEMEAGRRRVTAEELAVLGKLYGVGVSWIACAQDDAADLASAKLELAAREIGRLKQADLERLLRLLVALRPERPHE